MAGGSRDPLGTSETSLDWASPHACQSNRWLGFACQLEVLGGRRDRTGPRGSLDAAGRRCRGRHAHPGRDVVCELPSAERGGPTRHCRHARTRPRPRHAASSPLLRCHPDRRAALPHHAGPGRDSEPGRHRVRPVDRWHSDRGARPGHSLLPELAAHTRHRCRALHLRRGHGIRVQHDPAAVSVNAGSCTQR